MVGRAAAEHDPHEDLWVQQGTTLHHPLLFFTLRLAALLCVVLRTQKPSPPGLRLEQKGEFSPI